MKPVETSTDYTRPYRHWSVALLNRAGRAARRLGLDDRMDADRLMAAARRKTGLSDFGDEWFLEPLEVLLESINEEAHLTPVGARLLGARIVSALAVRLRAERLLREHPEIRDLDLGKVIVIAGLQRTATTTLHRLIAADPGVR
ncbi:MAG: sulfotransferase, partial [Acidobacteriota bacterium]|nr:sulfotransferase [Acidobacteriota bacterium]